MDANTLHRLTKSLLDSGEATTIEQARAKFARYGVRVHLDVSIAGDPALQLIALTVINLASRSFIGNVAVSGSTESVLAIGPFRGQPISAAVQHLGLTVAVKATDEGWPQIHVGAPSSSPSRAAIRPWAAGWQYGVGEGPAKHSNFFAPAAVAAAGLAVSEAFSILRCDNPYAGRRDISLSLWSVGGDVDITLAQGPALEMPTALPDLWVVGLGHLGQAYCWTLGFMDLAPGRQIYLQDVDEVTASTPSTSVLTRLADVGKRKTRVVARWFELCGIQTAIVERRFDEHQRVSASEPGTALFGVDNAAARRSIENAGFRFIVDAGLGSGYQDFRGIRVRTFPGPAKAAELWAAQAGNPTTISAPAYQALIAGGADPCGVTQLATRAVGAPFVGCVAAAYVLAEVCRAQVQGRRNAVIDLSLRTPTALERA